MKHRPAQYQAAQLYPFSQPILKYFKHLSIRLFFVSLGIPLLLTAWSLAYAKQHISLLFTASLFVFGTLAWQLACSINRIRRYAEAMAANRTAIKPQFGDSYLYRLVNAVAHPREKLDHRQHIESYALGLTHELKTPLTAQQAALELLQDGGLSPGQQQLVTRIVRNTREQKQLIARLLELARLENRDSLRTVQTVDLAALSAKAADECRAALHAKDLQVALDCRQKHPVQGDPLFIRQAVDNLLYNAIDFVTGHSGIKTSFAENSKQIELYVYNRGEPIPEFALDRIPQRFHLLPHADGARSNGLGLNSASEIMRLHHGGFVLRNHGNGVLASLIFTVGNDGILLKVETVTHGHSYTKHC